MMCPNDNGFTKHVRYRYALQVMKQRMCVFMYVCMNACMFVYKLGMVEPKRDRERERERDRESLYYVCVR